MLYKRCSRFPRHFWSPNPALFCRIQGRKRVFQQLRLFTTSIRFGLSITYYRAMFWELRQVGEGIRDEIRGWKKFKHATGNWPVYSIVASTGSIPAIFVGGMYLLISWWKAATHVSTIYASLFGTVIGGGVLWYLLRFIARKADLRRAESNGRSTRSSPALENLLR